MNALLESNLKYDTATHKVFIKLHDNQPQPQENVLGNRHIHIDILIEKYQETCERIHHVLKEIEIAKQYNQTLDSSCESILIKERLQKSTQARKSYLASIEQQALQLKTEIERFKANR